MTAISESRPSWARELKPETVTKFRRKRGVAPLVGA